MKGFNRVISLIGAVVVLAACDASTPSHVYTNKMRVKEQMVTAELDAAAMDKARVHVVAEDIRRRSKGDISLTVPYMPGGMKEAEKVASIYKKALEKEGIRDVSVATVQVDNIAYVRKAVISYRALAAIPAEGCSPIPGALGAETKDEIAEYKYGCEMQAVMSKMVADPSDFLGKAGTQDGNSRRNGAIIEPYKAGTPNQKMQGLNASQIGTGG